MDMTTNTATTKRRTIQLEVRSSGSAWQRIGSWWTERTAYAHLASAAENSANPDAWYRLAVYENGANYYAGDAPTEVLATRNGCAQVA